jgi:hypothetical protein
LKPGDVIVHEGSLEYSGGLPFYLGHRVRVLNGKRGDLDFGSRDEETKGLFLDGAEFSRLWDSGQVVFLVTRSGLRKSVVQGLPPERGILVGEFGSRSLYSNKLKPWMENGR